MILIYGRLKMMQNMKFNVYGMRLEGCVITFCRIFPGHLF